MSTDATALIRNHLQAARKGVDAVMQDFTHDSVPITPDATYRGLAEIRHFYTAFLSGLPEGFFDAFKMNRQEVVGDVAYILWEAKPWVLLATDTFVVRDGKCFRPLRRIRLRSNRGCHFGFLNFFPIPTFRKTRSAIHHRRA